ncbi:MAG: nitroreductase family protein [Desulfurella sp.]|jgi:nitroreductase|uniref:Nitroreductase n=1 Tax=Desulfurella multipotens TaxID=79269 RepID=A0A1G6I0S3_9BACT|nr:MULTISPECIES: nitroreductase family protein [Desulfurella]AHF97412.1 nitroreductase [Desulfurella acetivorans A63]HEX13104.1 nitroreductase [Desulfurella acetivorans]PMP65981.1 MAG: nitroreductase [Desulfurella multipotens]PMP87211.1 MAG: nitroreductase [Desulfurella sp.]SDB99665.1 Nitroreductase [Desulfurella multipotens]
MLDELIMKNRSYRKFAQVKIDCNTINNILRILRFIPSAKNAQPLKYIASCNEEKNEQIFSTLKWAGYLTDWDGPDKSQRPSAYIVILQDKNISNDNFVLTDAGIALQTILLKSVEMGLGGCTIAAIDKPRLSSILKLKDNLEILYVVAIGKPAETIKIVDAKNDIKYYRINNIHYVPKRSLSELIYAIIE